MYYLIDIHSSDLHLASFSAVFLLMERTVWRTSSGSVTTASTSATGGGVYSTTLGVLISGCEVHCDVHWTIVSDSGDSPPLSPCTGERL